MVGSSPTAGSILSEIMKIPKGAKRVFKGIIFDVYQWQQKMFDGSLETFEAIKRQKTVVIIPTFKNKIVLIKQKQPNTGWFYSFPSGRMDKQDKNPKTAALRELKEETGLTPKKVVLWKTINNGGKTDHDVYIFLAKDCRKTHEQQLDAGEKVKVYNFAFDEFLKLSDSEYFIEKSILIDLLKARLSKKYCEMLKKAFFGNLSSLPKTASLAKPGIFC